MGRTTVGKYTIVPWLLWVFAGSKINNQYVCFSFCQWFIFRNVVQLSGSKQFQSCFRKRPSYISAVFIFKKNKQTTRLIRDGWSKWSQHDRECNGSNSNWIEPLDRHELLGMMILECPWSHQVGMGPYLDWFRERHHRLYQVPSLRLVGGWVVLKQPLVRRWTMMVGRQTFPFLDFGSANYLRRRHNNLTLKILLVTWMVKGMPTRMLNWGRIVFHFCGLKSGKCSFRFTEDWRKSHQNLDAHLHLRYTNQPNA